MPRPGTRSTGGTWCSSTQPAGASATTRPCPVSTTRCWNPVRTPRTRCTPSASSTRCMSTPAGQFVPGTCTGSSPGEASQIVADSSSLSSRQLPLALKITSPSVSRTSTGRDSSDQSQRQVTGTRPRSGMSAEATSVTTRSFSTSTRTPSIGVSRYSSRSLRGSMRRKRAASPVASAPRNSMSGGLPALTMRTRSGGNAATVQLPSRSGLDLPLPENRTRCESSSVTTHHCVGTNSSAPGTMPW